MSETPLINLFNKTSSSCCTVQAAMARLLRQIFSRMPARFGVKAVFKFAYLSYTSMARLLTQNFSRLSARFGVRTRYKFAYQLK